MQRNFGLEKQDAIVAALKSENGMALASLTVDLTAKAIVHDRLSKYGKEPIPPTLRKILRDHREEGIRQVSLLVIDLCDTFNVASNMNEKQILNASIGIMGEFPQLTLLDVAACFKQAKTGGYGKVYNRIDLQVLCEFLKTYERERTEYIVEFRQKENEAWKHNTTTSEDVKKDYKRLLDEAAEKAAKMEEELKKRRNNEFQSEINRTKFTEQYGTNQHREEPTSAKNIAGSKSGGDSGDATGKTG